MGRIRSRREAYEKHARNNNNNYHNILLSPHLLLGTEESGAWPAVLFIGMPNRICCSAKM
jgi:hypothetical protein